MRENLILFSLLLSFFSCTLKSETDFKKTLTARGSYTVKDGFLIKSTVFSKKIEYDLKQIKIGENIHKVDSINILNPSESFYYFKDSVMEIVPSLDKDKYEVYFYKSSEPTTFKQYYLCVEE